VDYADFGRYLTQQRELRGVSRSEVAKATKIPLNLLTALENGQLERLPERIFVLNYIRAYSQVIGLAEDEAILRFEEIDKGSRAPPEPKAAAPRPGRTLLKWLLAIIALLVILYLALMLAGHLRPLWGRR
jgi:cytoskeletal protein RodZ